MNSIPDESLHLETTPAMFREWVAATLDELGWTSAFGTRLDWRGAGRFFVTPTSSGDPSVVIGVEFDPQPSIEVGDTFDLSVLAGPVFDDPPGAQAAVVFRVVPLTSARIRVTPHVMNERAAPVALDLVNTIYEDWPECARVPQPNPQADRIDTPSLPSRKLTKSQRRAQENRAKTRKWDAETGPNKLTRPVMADKLGVSVRTVYTYLSDDEPS